MIPAIPHIFLLFLVLLGNLGATQQQGHEKKDFWEAKDSSDRIDRIVKTPH
jgi:hypothetical protein